MQLVWKDDNQSNLRSKREGNGMCDAVYDAVYDVDGRGNCILIHGYYKLILNLTSNNGMSNSNDSPLLLHYNT